MPKPVPADAMRQQPTEASRHELKAREVQEDEQAQTIAAQSDNGSASTSPPMQAQMNGGSVQAVQTKLQEALKPSRQVLSFLHHMFHAIRVKGMVPTML